MRLWEKRTEIENENNENAYFCTAQMFAAQFRQTSRVLHLFLRRGCGLESCFAEVLRSFSSFLLTRSAFAQFNVVVLGGLSRLFCALDAEEYLEHPGSVDELSFESE